jgi:hypothetical protein
MNLTDLLLINLSGDLDDLQSVFPSPEDEKSLDRWREWSFAELENRLARIGRCSVLVKVISFILAFICSFLPLHLIIFANKPR